MSCMFGPKRSVEREYLYLGRLLRSRFVDARLRTCNLSLDMASKRLAYYGSDLHALIANKTAGKLTVGLTTPLRLQPKEDGGGRISHGRYVAAGFSSCWNASHDCSKERLNWLILPDVTPCLSATSLVEQP